MLDWFLNPYAIPIDAFLLLWGFLIIAFIIAVIVGVVRSFRERDDEESR